MGVRSESTIDHFLVGVDVGRVLTPIDEEVHTATVTGTDHKAIVWRMQAPLDEPAPVLRRTTTRWRDVTEEQLATYNRDFRAVIGRRRDLTRPARLGDIDSAVLGAGRRCLPQNRGGARQTLVQQLQRGRPAIDPLPEVPRADQQQQQLPAGPGPPADQPQPDNATATLHREMVSLIERSLPPHIVQAVAWKAMGKFYALDPSSSQQHGPLRRADTGELIWTGEGKTNLFAEHIVRLHSHPPGYVADPYQPTGVPMQPAQLAELRAAIAKAPPGKCADPSLVTAEHFKKLDDKSLVDLLASINVSLTSATCPDHWRRANVVGLLKPARDPAAVASLRPVAVTSALARIVERIPEQRIRHFFTLHESQFGFRPNVPASLPLLGISMLAEDLKVQNAVVIDSSDPRKDNAARRKKRTQCILLGCVDGVSAFCRGIADRVAKIIAEHGTGELRGEADWVHAFLTKRKILVRYGDVITDALEIDRGFPQGTVLGPLLWAIFMNDLVGELEDICAVDDAEDDEFKADLWRQTAESHRDNIPSQHRPDEAPVRVVAPTRGCGRARSWPRRRRARSRGSGRPRSWSWPRRRGTRSCSGTSRRPRPRRARWSWARPRYRSRSRSRSATRPWTRGRTPAVVPLRFRDSRGHTVDAWGHQATASLARRLRQPNYLRRLHNPGAGQAYGSGRKPAPIPNVFARPLIVADDINLVCVHSDPARCIAKANVMLSAVARWADSVGLQLAKMQAGFIVPGAKNSGAWLDEQSRTLRCGPLELVPRGADLKLLGVHIDASLTFAKHLEQTIAKARGRLAFLAPLAWRVPQHVLRDVYVACVLTPVLYACEAWFSWIGKTNATVMDELESLHYAGARFIAGLAATTDGTSAVVEAGLDPLTKYIETAIVRNVELLAHIPEADFGPGWVARLAHTPSSNPDAAFLSVRAAETVAPCEPDGADVPIPLEQRHRFAARRPFAPAATGPADKVRILWEPPGNLSRDAEQHRKHRANALRLREARALAKRHGATWLEIWTDGSLACGDDARTATRTAAAARGRCFASPTTRPTATTRFSSRLPSSRHRSTCSRARAPRPTSRRCWRPSPPSSPTRASWKASPPSGISAATDSQSTWTCDRRGAHSCTTPAPRAAVGPIAPSVRASRHLRRRLHLRPLGDRRQRDARRGGQGRGRRL